MRRYEAEFAVVPQPTRSVPRRTYSTTAAASAQPAVVSSAASTLTCSTSTPPTTPPKREAGGHAGAQPGERLGQRARRREAPDQREARGRRGRDEDPGDEQQTPSSRASMPASDSVARPRRERPGEQDQQLGGVARPLASSVPERRPPGCRTRASRASRRPCRPSPCSCAKAGSATSSEPNVMPSTMLISTIVLIPARDERAPRALPRRLSRRQLRDGVVAANASVPPATMAAATTSAVCGVRERHDQLPPAAAR